MICTVAIKNGHLQVTPSLDAGPEEQKNCKKFRIRRVHGFNYLVDLDVYRSPEALKWYDIMIGDSKYARRWDDQLAVTMPGAMFAPDRSWDMGYHDIDLQILHNGVMNARKKATFYKVFWKNETNFPEARQSCSPFVKYGGR